MLVRCFLAFMLPVSLSAQSTIAFAHINPPHVALQAVLYAMCESLLSMGLSPALLYAALALFGWA